MYKVIDKSLAITDPEMAIIAEFDTLKEAQAECDQLNALGGESFEVVS